MSIPDTSGQTGTVQEFYEALLRTQTASANHLTKFQDNVLKDLLAFLAGHVPYYRERLAPVFRADGSFNPENWMKLPILTAAELRANPEAFRPSKLPAAHGGAARYVSSGSTGRPMTYYRSALSDLSQNAAHYRHYTAFQLDPRRDMAMIRAFDRSLARSRPQPADPSKMPWTADWFAGGTPGHVKQLSVFTPIAAQVEWLCGLGKIYLNTFPSNVLALARHVAKNPGAKPDLLAIFTVGEPLTGEVRRQCAEHLGCSCINMYSSAECGLIACDCPEAGVMHIQSELCRVEILGRDNNPVRPGGFGRLIVTPLYNFAMPLVRYDTGDLVRAAPPCGCGRGHQALDPVIGRPSNMFHLPGKTWFRPSFPVEMMEDLLGHSRWQLVQTGASDFELRYMPRDGVKAVDARKLRAAIGKALGPGIALQITPVAALGPAASGKFLAIVNRHQSE